MTFPSQIVTGALISACGLYRYTLERTWDRRLKRVAFIGLNPSTADAAQDDPTIRRCIGFGRAWGFGGIVMLNLFAFRATDPEKCRVAHDPIGPNNNGSITDALIEIDDVVAAWGGNAEWIRPGRAAFVSDLVRSYRRKFWCLGCNKDGTPKHPLYLAGQTQLQEFVG